MEMKYMINESKCNYFYLPWMTTIQMTIFYDLNKKQKHAHV